MATSSTPVFEFTLDDGTPVGCGTQAEFDHWTAEGVFDGYCLGRLIGHEPASEDERRKAAWSRTPA